MSFISDCVGRGGRSRVRWGIWSRVRWLTISFVTAANYESHPSSNNSTNDGSYVSSFFVFMGCNQHKYLVYLDYFKEF